MATKAANKGAKSKATGTPVVKPRAPGSGFGFARKKDINDQTDQARAPHGPSRSYDRAGDDEFSQGMKSFEEAGGSRPADDAQAMDRKRPGN